MLTNNIRHPTITPEYENSNFDISTYIERSIFRLHFDQVNEGSMYFFTRVLSHSSNCPEFILVQRNHIDCRQEQYTSPGVALCFDFVYYWCQPFFLFAPWALVRFPFSLNSPPSLPLHTAKPFGRYSAPSLQILYHFYEA